MKNKEDGSVSEKKSASIANGISKGMNEKVIPDTVSLDEATDELVIIDQTRLPNELVLLRLSELRDICDAIYKLCVRGAPAIGVAAAVGMYAVASRFDDVAFEGFSYSFKKHSKVIQNTRPTARNLSWALERMEKIVFANREKSIADIKSALKTEAKSIIAEDINVCRTIGLNGAPLISSGDGILTHCNAGRLAAVRYGTSLAPMYIAHENGTEFKVYCDETRPLLQGARLTAYELSESGIETCLICDSAASSLMKSGAIKSVFVGCDRVAANGDFANKIGTLSVAVNAAYYGIPFYVCAPLSTVDFNCPSGDNIVIEERNGSEIGEMWYRTRMTPNNIEYRNPAFDVTPASLVTSYITEKGVFTDINSLVKMTAE